MHQTKEELNEARRELGVAIQKFYNTLEGDYVSSWVVLTERVPADPELFNATTLGIVSAEDQSFITTRGMLEIAKEHKSVTGSYSN